MSTFSSTNRHNTAIADTLNLQGIQRSLQEGAFTSEALVDVCTVWWLLVYEFHTDFHSAAVPVDDFAGE